MDTVGRKDSCMDGDRHALTFPNIVPFGNKGLTPKAGWFLQILVLSGVEIKMGV